MRNTVVLEGAAADWRPTKDDLWCPCRDRRLGEVNRQQCTGGTFDAQLTSQGLHHVGRRVDVDDLFWAVADAHTHTDLLVLVATAAGISSLQIGQE